MPQLYVLNGRMVGRSFTLKSGDVLGRAEENAVNLIDASISRRHARIQFEDERWWLVDLDSRNGTLVSGRRISRAELTDGDEFFLGQLLIRFRREEIEPGTDDFLEFASESGSARASQATRAPKPDGGETFELPSLAPEPSPEFSNRAAAGELHQGGEVASPGRVGSAPVRRVGDEKRQREERLRAMQTKPGGLFAGDLDQWPLGLRWLAYALILAVAGLLAFGSFKLIHFLRGGS